MIKIVSQSKTLRLSITIPFENNFKKCEDEKSKLDVKLINSNYKKNSLNPDRNLFRQLSFLLHSQRKLALATPYSTRAFRIATFFFPLRVSHTARGESSRKLWGSIDPHLLTIFFIIIHRFLYILE